MFFCAIFHDDKRFRFDLLHVIFSDSKFREESC